jgi:hypothetical protein
MPLTRGRMLGYDVDRMAFEFTMLNKDETVPCEISSAAMDDRNDDPLTETVAKKIIEVSKAGINDPAQVSQLAIKDLRFSWGVEPTVALPDICKK